MRNPQYYKRILAGLVSASLMLGSLGTRAQVVLAAEISADAATEAAVEESVSTQEIEDTPTENITYIEETGGVTTEEPSTGTDETTQDTKESTDSVERIEESGSAASEGEKAEEDREPEQSDDGKEPEQTEEIEESGKVGETEAEDETEQSEDGAGKDDGEELVTYTAKADGIRVRAEAAAGVLPEGAVLRAHRIESEQDLEKVTEELDSSDVEYDDYLALDVCFYNADGDEIEPDGKVAVTFELEDTVLPENVKADSVAVQHFDESRYTTDVVTVADTTDDDNTGTVEFSKTETIETPAGQDDIEVVAADATVKAEFEVESFSTFTLTWTWGDQNYSEKLSLSVTCVDEDGSAISELPAGASSGTLDLGTDKPDDKNYTLTTDSELLAISGYRLTAMTVNYTRYAWNGPWQQLTTTSYDGLTSIVIHLQGGGFWNYTFDYNGAQTTVYSNENTGYEKQTVTLTLTYEQTGPCKIQYSLKSTNNADGGTQTGSGEVPATQTAYRGTTITLPTLSDDQAPDGYEFMGWFEQDTFNVKTGTVTDLSTIYEAGADYKVTGNKTLYALWASTTASAVKFYLRTGGDIPDGNGKVSTPNELYTNAIVTADYLRHKMYIYNNELGEIVTGTEDGKEIYSIAQNRVYRNLTGYPHNSEIRDALNAVSNLNNKSGSYTQYGVSSDTVSKVSKDVYANYHVDVNDAGQLYVDAVYVNGEVITSKTHPDDYTDYVCSNGFRVGDTLYVLYYTQKYEWGGSAWEWHVDGIVMTTNKISVIYNANAPGNYNGMPTSYQMDKDDGNAVQFTAGVSGQASGTVPDAPTRTGYKFLYWNTKADGSGDTYLQGDTVSTKANITLYAIWGSGTEGALKITKAVKAGGSAAAGTKYKIQVTIPGSLKDGHETYDATIYNADGSVAVATYKVDFASDDRTQSEPEVFELEDGQYVIIEGLSDGETYEVGEIELPEGYSVCYTDANGARYRNNKAVGQILGGGTMEVTVTNAPRIVKTGVDIGAHPMEAAAVMAVMVVVLGVVYEGARRRYR